MALKAALSKKGMRLQELKNLNHELPKIWRAFKENYGADPRGTNFDAIVSNLHRFEEIRYPQFNPPPTMSTTIGIGKPGNATTLAPHPGEKRYELWLGEIDELMGQIFTVASINPKAFTSGLFPRARTHLTAENEEAPWQLS